MLIPAFDVAVAPPHPSLPVPPLAVQDVASDVDQLSVVEPPAVSQLGLALKLTTVAGCGGAETVTVTDCTALAPPGPVHESEYVYVPGLANGPMVVPLLESPWLPGQPSDPVPPDPVQDVASRLDHAKLVDCP